MAALYDRIGRTYASSRAPDPRIAARIRAAIGDAPGGVVNVGAGAGAYEPADLDVVAIEPSATMSAQRPAGDRARVIQASAEALPLADDSVDVAMTVLSDHHWTDRAAGLRELARVARRRVVLCNDEPGTHERFWLTRDYLPSFLDLVPERYRADPGLWRAELEELLGGTVVVGEIPIPHDCQDGFYRAFWRRPEAYINPEIRDNISVFRKLPREDVVGAVERLEADLDSGAWHARNAELLGREAYDVGLRVVVAELG
jgi:SAM-dependent methyltransferase